MSEVDVDAQIKNYWQKIEELSTNEERIKAWEYERFGGNRGEFYDPDASNPMRLALFLSYLDITLLEDAMRPYYKRVGSVQYLGAMGLSLIYMKLGELTPDQMANHLETHPGDAELLRYKKGDDGKFKIPNGETFRYNLRERFGPEGIKEIDRAILGAVSRAANELGIELGECCGSDAFPLKSVKSDKEAEYNDHYEINGYKVAMTESYGTETGIVPLTGKVIGINEDEGKELIPQIQKLKECEINIKEDWVDGKYATIENIAYAEVIECTKLHYDTAENWVYNHEATPEKIKRDYQKFYNEPDFQVGASQDSMMAYLVRRGHVESVGYMLRNEHIAAKEECPDGYLDDFHRRNITESENDRIKNDKGLQRAVRRKGKDTIELQFQLTLLALHVIALVRLQKGFKKNLVSTRGLT